MGCNKQKGSEEVEYSLDEFEAFIKNVKDDFTYNGYEEIMKDDKSVVLALPLEYEKIDEAVNYCFS